MSEVVLRLCAGDTSGACVIRCSSCSERFETAADDPMVVMLLALGVDVSIWHGPPAVEWAHGPLGAITLDDVETFRADLLEETDIPSRLSPG